MGKTATELLSWAKEESRGAMGLPDSMILESATATDAANTISQAKSWSEVEAVFKDIFGEAEKKPRTRKEYVDVGEKIGGARKDIWKDIVAGKRSLEASDMEGMDSGTASKFVTKKNVTQGVLDDLIENGTEPGTAFMVDRLFFSITPKPNDTDQDRKNFVASMDRIKEYLRGAKSLEEFDKVILQIREEIRGWNLSPDEKALHDEAVRRRGEWSKARTAKWNEIVEEQRETNRRFDSYTASKILREWEDQNVTLQTKSWDRYDEYWDAKQEWERREIENPDSKRNQYASLGEKFANAVFNKTDSFVKNRVKADRITDLSWKKEGKKGGKGKTKKPKWVRQVPEQVERSGGQERDFKPQDLLDTFKVRGVEYGNWMDEETSQHHTQMLGLGFMDMSDILDVPLEHVSYGGRLAIAFGARGSGGALAHYEPDKKAINLTKLNGGGSLAHEWAHFLDNVVHMVSTGESSKHGFGSTVASGSGDSRNPLIPFGDQIPPEVSEAYSEVWKSMTKGDIRPEKSKPEIPDGYSESRLSRILDTRIQELGPQGAMDLFGDAKRTAYSRKKGSYKKNTYSKKDLAAIAGYIHKSTGTEVGYGEPKSAFLVDSEEMTAGTKSYWTRPHEMFARAFEAVMNKKLKDKGMVNTYLVSGVEDPFAPYPRGEELARLEKAFDKLIGSLKEGQVLESAMALQEEIDKAALSPKNDLPEPSQAQKESGNYKKSHISIGGLKIAIENPEGSKRSGVDKDGTEWSITMKSHYGYVKGSIGRDKDHVDVFIKPGIDTENIVESPVFIVNQVHNGTNIFDEHKCMLGWDNENEAKKAYLANYEEGWQGVGSVVETSFGDFKGWVLDPKSTKQPATKEGFIFESYFTKEFLLKEAAKYDLERHIQKEFERVREAKKAKRKEFADPSDGSAFYEHDYKSILLMPLPETDAEVVMNFAQALPAEEMVERDDTGEPWIERNPHVTVKYGIASSVSVDGVKSNLPRYAEKDKVYGTYGRLSVFEKDEHDVLYIEVKSLDLQVLNGVVSSTVDCEESDYSEYVPHVTVAYLKPGNGEKYKGLALFDELKFETGVLSYCTGTGENYPIDLTNQRG